MNNVFTGGETIIQGFKKNKNKYEINVPKFWTPTLFRSVIYSEILDKYFSVILTKRVVELVHEHKGLDNYLLKVGIIFIVDFFFLNFIMNN